MAALRGRRLQRRESHERPPVVGGPDEGISARDAAEVVAQGPHVAEEVRRGLALLEAELEELANELRQELNHFAGLINQPHGQEEQSQHDLLWQELQLRCELMAASIEPSIHEIEIQEACSKSKQRIERNSQLLVYRRKPLRYRYPYR